MHPLAYSCGMDYKIHTSQKHLTSGKKHCRCLQTVKSWQTERVGGWRDMESVIHSFTHLVQTFKVSHNQHVF